MNIEKKMVYSNNYFEVYATNGVLTVYNKYGGSVIVPVTQERNLLMLEIFRQPVGCVSLEFPRGFSEINEKGVDTACRELLEEISCNCEEFLPMGSIYPDTGLTNNRVEIVMGLGARRQNKKVQIREGIKAVRELSLSEVWDLAMNNEIKDGFSLAALVLTKKHFELNS